ncbi:MAG: UvrD-helicase domain-containing protein [Treponema sp.]|nr:UvrD-helicase domain-containing protein [Treponema sp.]
MADKSTLTENQRRAVEERGNVVVSAGAGSGKTKVLSIRFADLVESGDAKVDRILTLTFMNKAAVEMKSRIFRQLSEDSVNAESEKERANAKEALETFDKAHIQTLDSYFSEIVRSGAHFYGISPSFKIDEEQINSLVGVKALQFVLAHAENKAVRALTRLYKFADIASGIFALPIIKNSSVISSSIFEKAFDNQLSEIEKTWNSCADKADSAIGKISLNLPVGKTKTIAEIKRISEIPVVQNPLSSGVLSKTFRETVESDFENVKSCVEKYMAYLGNWTQMTKPRGKDVAEILPYFDEIYESVNCLIYVSEWLLNFDTIKETMRLLDLFNSEVQEAKRSSGLLTFRDISELALDILKNRAEIRHIEQQRFDKIMIDEFQDNNALQCDALFMLSDEKERFGSDGKYIVPNFDPDSDDYIQKRLSKNKLFFVGDEKQGIYRFRGADVCVFRNLQKHLRGENFSDGRNYIYLETNFRSMPNLVDAFNVIFGGKNEKGEKSVLMKKEDETEIPEYEAEYLKVEWNSQKEETEGKKRAHVAFFRKTEETENDSEDSGTAFEASYIAHKIKSLVKSGYKYSDIAVLFMASSVIGDLESEFLKARIPYSTEVYKGFFSDGPINDIISFLKVCVYPDDMNSYSVLLRSPFVNLSREEMERFLSEIRICKDDASLEGKIYPFDEKSLEIAAEVFGENSVAFGNIKTAKERFDLIKEMLRTEKISKIISKLWYEFGYRYETLWNCDVQMFASLYDILFELARKSEENTQSLAEFLDSVEEYNSDVSKIENLNIPFESNDGVKFITIHKSKGLEYKVVFICAAEYEFPSRPVPLAFTKNFGPVLSVPPSSIFKKIKSKDKYSFYLDPKKSNANYFMEAESRLMESEAAAELRRLTYVAFTRAIDEIFVVGKYDRFYKGELCKDVIPILPTSIFATFENVLERYTELDSEKDGFVRHAAADSPFDYEEFSNKFSYDEDANTKEEKNAESKSAMENFRNDAESKIRFAKCAAKSFGSATVIEKDFVEPVYLNPSSLEKRIGYSEADSSAVPMPEIDALVERTIPGREKIIEWYEKWNAEHPDEQQPVKLPRPRFGYDSFGTVAHLALEEKINSVKENREMNLKIPEKLLIGLDVDSPLPADSEIDSYERNKIELEQICKKMTDDFSKTKLFSEICASDWKKTEYQFRLSLEKIGRKEIATGSIDLVFAHAEPDSPYRYTIVDYKTDRHQVPERYTDQLACYRLAISEMTGTPIEKIRCVLYYLRSGRLLEVNVS